MGLEHEFHSGGAAICSLRDGLTMAGPRDRAGLWPSRARSGEEVAGDRLLANRRSGPDTPLMFSYGARPSVSAP